MLPLQTHSVVCELELKLKNISDSVQQSLWLDVKEEEKEFQVKRVLEDLNAEL